MIDVVFNQYTECLFYSMEETQRVRVGQWTHVHITIYYETKEVAAAIILNNQYEPTKVFVQEEGAESMLLQFTAKEKEQILHWFHSTQR